MKTIKAAHRLSATLPTKPNKPPKRNWIDNAEKKQEGKPRNPANDLPEGLFNKGVGEIVNTLKTKCKDFKQALSKVSYLSNRSGDNFDRNRKHKMNQVKEALYRAYGRELPKQDQT